MYCGAYYRNVAMTNNEKRVIEPQKSGKVMLYICLFEFFLLSGVERMTRMIGYNRLLIFFPLTCLICNQTISKTIVPRISRPNLMTAVGMISLLLLSTIMAPTTEFNNMWISFASCIVGLCLLSSCLDFCYFRKAIFSVFWPLTVISIVVQLAHDILGLFPAVPYVVGNRVVNLSLGLFTTEWGESRLASIFWEPGQYQVVIFYILFMFIDELTDFSNLKRNLWKFGPIFLGILMTQSTTGYAVMALLLLTMMVKSKLKPSYFVLYAIFCVGAYFLYNSDAIQKKVEQSQNQQEESSFTIRMADNLACLQATMERPIIGWGGSNMALNKRLNNLGNETSSNAWLYATAMFGIPIVLWIVLCMFKNIRRLQPLVPSLVMLLALVLSQGGEPRLYCPYLYMYVFTFRYYSQLKLARR